MHGEPCITEVLSLGGKQQREGLAKRGWPAEKTIGSAEED